MSALLNWFYTGLGTVLAKQHAICNLNLISAKTGKQGIECTKAKGYIRAYSPDTYIALWQWIDIVYQSGTWSTTYDSVALCALEM